MFFLGSGEILGGVCPMRGRSVNFLGGGSYPYAHYGDGLRKAFSEYKGSPSCICSAQSYK